ncbi:protein phosphatase 2C domain-containing protein [Streptomyces sp. BK205]|uniref:protein phosphatase 2C domain-containing protein n=1 Tax=Streptomyces sp. BK205 TaxID=2512164 RepID=UPI0010D56D15|nr:protein phosphatase 2C domain-containing protein [Streptomyces sp. BK205]TCR22679.1 protein phosphatase 2C-like protein [Streptomyces sp. BK205]
MSQQGGRPTGHEDDWWGQLYDSTDDTGPAPAPDTLDDRFASAAGAVEDGGGGAAGPSARSAGGVPAPRFPEPGVAERGFSESGVAGAGFSGAGVTESGFSEPGVAESGFSGAGVEPGATAPGFSEPGDVPPRTSSGRDPGRHPRSPQSPPGTAQGPVAFPPGPTPPGFDERGPSDLPPSPPGGRTSTETPPVTNIPASRRPPDAPRPPTAAPPPPSAPPRPVTPPPLPEDGDWGARGNGGAVRGSGRDGASQGAAGRVPGGGGGRSESGAGFGRPGAGDVGAGAAPGDNRPVPYDPGDSGEVGSSAGTDPRAGGSGTDSRTGDSGADPRTGDPGPDPRTADPGVGPDPRRGNPDAASVSPGGSGDASSQAGPHHPGTPAVRRDEPTHRAEGDWWATPAPGAPQPAAPTAPHPAAPTAPTGPGSTQPNPTPEPPDQVRDATSGAGASPQRGETTADRHPEPGPHPAPNASSAPGPTADPAPGAHPSPVPDRPSAASHVTSSPSPTPDPATGPHPTPPPDPPSAAPDLTSPPPPDPLRTATRVDLPTLPPAPVGFVGSGPPTYDAEPTALPAADPDELDDLVADTVLDGARYGACTLRAVSVRGDSARFRGEPRRDSLLTARFGTGDQALVLVAMATGARATPGAHRAAAEACQWIARAVGRSHARLAQDIGAARRGDLKSGLHRLTDRSLGRLRASAAEQGVDPEEYAATLRCLLLPADPDCRVRVFFGVGDGGLFRLRDGEWHDIEPLVSDVTGEPVVGFGSLPSETPDGDRLTMDLGIPTPPSPYEPAPEPPRAPFRFRASVARPGDTLLMCTGGLAEPLRGEPELCEYLTGRWSGPPPGLAAFLADSQVRVKGYADDRTAAAVWEA